MNKRTKKVLSGMAFVSIFVFAYFLMSSSAIVNRLETDLKKLEPNLSFIVLENKMNGVTVTFAKSVIYICTDTKEYNTLLYVAIHELAHVKNESYGHDASFIKTFQELLDRAQRMGIYKYVDFTRTPKKYCNMTLDRF